MLMLVDSQVTVGAVSKGRSSSRRVNYWLRRIAGLCLSFALFVDLVWIPTKANPADAPSRSASLAEWWGEVLELQGESAVSMPEILPASVNAPGACKELELLSGPYPVSGEVRVPAARLSAADSGPSRSLSGPCATAPVVSTLLEHPAMPAPTLTPPGTY